MDLTTAKETFLRAKLIANCRPDTLISYRSILTHFIHQSKLAGTDSITVDSVREYLAVIGNGRRASSVEQHRITVVCWLRWLHKEGIIDLDVSGRIPRVRTDATQPRCLSADELTRFYTALEIAPRKSPLTHSRNAALLHLMVDAGLRLGETIGIRLADVDVGERTVRLEMTKGRKWRLVRFTSDTARLLRSYLRHRGNAPGSLWLDWRGRSPIDRSCIIALVRRTACAAGLAGVHAHTLRHTAATAWIEAGMPVTSVQRLLGHARLETTMGYVHLADRTALQDYDKYVR